LLLLLKTLGQNAIVKRANRHDVLLLSSLVRFLVRRRRRRLRRRIEVLVPTAALELERRGRDQPLELGLMADGAVGERGVLDRLERLHLVLTGLAAILVRGHLRTSRSAKIAIMRGLSIPGREC